MILERRRFIYGLVAAGGCGYAAQPRAATASRVLFSQPNLVAGIAPSFSVTGAVPRYNPVDAFYLHANQPNPYRADAWYVPVRWPVGELTGLFVVGDPADWQRGIITEVDSDGHGHTAVQAYGDSVGAFLNSTDLKDGSQGNRMMVAPQYRFGVPPVAFPTPGAMLGVSLDVQVPVATDFHVTDLSNTYVKIDLLLICVRSGHRLSLSCTVFANDAHFGVEKTRFDVDTGTVIMAAHVDANSQRLSLLPGSATLRTAPWTGWQTFAFTVSQAQFTDGLRAAQRLAQRRGRDLSTDPADYVLLTTHLNAELHHTPATPATLGWSMRRLTITQTA